jgi:uncharacterized protein YjiS (DUF1127 family)
LAEDPKQPKTRVSLLAKPQLQSLKLWREGRKEERKELRELSTCRLHV